MSVPGTFSTWRYWKGVKISSLSALTPKQRSHFSFENTTSHPAVPTARGYCQNPNLTAAASAPSSPCDKTVTNRDRKWNVNKSSYIRIRSLLCLLHVVSAKRNAPKLNIYLRLSLCNFIRSTIYHTVPDGMLTFPRFHRVLGYVCMCVCVCQLPKLLQTIRQPPRKKQNTIFTEQDRWLLFLPLTSRHEVPRRKKKYNANRQRIFRHQPYLSSREEANLFRFVTIHIILSPVCSRHLPGRTFSCRGVPWKGRQRHCRVRQQQTCQDANDRLTHGQILVPFAARVV